MIKLTEYKIVNGTYYDSNTPVELIKVLENIRNRGTRIKIAYGDQMTGRDWEETHDIAGYIGRSTGQVKIPLLMYNQRSMGGGGILTASIVKIEYANKKQGGVMWQHPNYHKGN